MAFLPPRWLDDALDVIALNAESGVSVAALQEELEERWGTVLDGFQLRFVIRQMTLHSDIQLSGLSDRAASVGGDVADARLHVTEARRRQALGLTAVHSLQPKQQELIEAIGRT
jgi:citrate lyase beta subunit